MMENRIKEFNGKSDCFKKAFKENGIKGVSVKKNNSFSFNFTIKIKREDLIEDTSLLKDWGKRNLEFLLSWGSMEVDRIPVNALKEDFLRDKVIKVREIVKSFHDNHATAYYGEYPCNFYYHIRYKLA